MISLCKDNAVHNSHTNHRVSMHKPFFPFHRIHSSGRFSSCDTCHHWELLLLQAIGSKVQHMVDNTIGHANNNTIHTKLYYALGINVLFHHMQNGNGHQ